LDAIGLDSLDKIIVFGNQASKWVEKIINMKILPKEVSAKKIKIWHYSYHRSKASASDDRYLDNVIEQLKKKNL